MKNRISPYKLIFCGLTTVTAFSLSSCVLTKNKEGGNIQPELGHRSVNIIVVDGYKFKDLNKNNSLDAYEDWRLSSDKRANDLIAKMSLEQKAGFMLISSTRLENDWSFGRPENQQPITSGFNEKDLVSTTNIFTRKDLDYPILSAAGTTKDVKQLHKRHFILRANPSPKILAEWANNLQALCESDDLGIPGLIASNTRNHLSTDVAIGLNVAETPFTTFPGELGLAAMRDMKLVGKFADICRQEWAAAGIRKGYMYMADLATEPRWQRVEGTFGEDSKLAANMMTEVVLGFQGTSLNQSSVALTTKHFPGGGATEGGQDPHFEWGKKELFAGGMFENNLIPFKAAIAAGTSSIMPYYSYPVNTEYEEVSYAYNKRILQDVLRKRLGFKGIINSDTGPIEMMPWGVEKLTIVERYKKALDAGVNLFSGTADPGKLIETIKKYPELMPLVDESVHKLLVEKFELGLFENPYVNVEAASQIIGNPKFKETADLTMRKSIVLLRNKENILPVKPKTKVYFEVYSPNKGNTSSTIFKTDKNTWDVEFLNTPDEADVVLLWLIPKGKSLFQSDGSPLHVNLSSNGIDVKYVNQITSKPTILVVNYTNPWAIDEIYKENSKNIKSVIATFGTTPEAILDVVMGKFKPTGKMPFSTPVTDEAAQNQKPDVPGYLEGNGYEFFKFNEGMKGY